MLRRKVQAQAESGTNYELRRLFLYVTRACNLHCRYCWVSAGLADVSELTTGEITRLLGAAAEMGVEEVKITGGEPFVRDDLLEILEGAGSLGLSLIVETNGTRIHEDTARRLARIPRMQVTVSLDGARAESHEFIRSEEGAFESTTRAIRVLAENGVPVAVTTVAHRMNLSEIRAIIELARSLGARNHRTILSLQKIGRGRSCEDIELAWPDIWDCVREVYRARKELELDISVGTAHSTLPPALQPPQDLELADCGWGRTLCGVLSNGAVSICGAAYNTMHLVAGNVRHQSLRDIWAHSSFFARLRAITWRDLQGICGNCVLAPACRGMCRVNAFAVYGALTAPYPLCQLAYERGAFPDYAMRRPRRQCNYAAGSGPSIPGGCAE